jgi:hypothetical protein
MNTQYNSPPGGNTYWIGEIGRPLSDDQKAKSLLSGPTCDNCRFAGPDLRCNSTERREHYEVLSNKRNGLRITYMNLPRADDNTCGWWEENDKK